MKVLIRFVILFFLCATLFSKGKEYGDLYVSNIVRVYDGDTITVDIEYLPEIIGEKISVRIYGIDTPEIRSKMPWNKKKAIQARDYLRKRLAEGESIVLKRVSRGKYFRLVGDLFIDESRVADELISLGLAREYYGKTKDKWE